MNGLQFAATVIGDLVWPGVSLTAIYVFRSELRNLLGSLRKFTWGDKVAEFDKRLGEAENEASALPPPIEPLALPAPDTATEEERFEVALELSPELAVLEAWIPVEKELQALAVRKGYTSSRSRSVTYTIRRLRSDGVLDARIENLLKELRELRNIAIHRRDGIPLTIDDAKRYEELASTVLEALRSRR